MTDLQQLARALEAEARQVDVGTPPTAALLADGQRVVRRRRLSLVSGLTLAAALVLGGVLGGVGPLDLDRPTPADRDHGTLRDLPVGAAPQVPYFTGLDLVTTDGRHQRVHNGPRLALGDDVVAFSGAATPGLQYSHFDGTGAGYLNGPGSPLIDPASVSPNGRWAAAAYATDAAPVRVQLFDLSADELVGVASFDTPPTPPTACCNSFDIIGIDDSGRVYAHGVESEDRAAYWRWTPGTDVRTQLRGLRGEIVSVRGDGHVVVARDDDQRTRNYLGVLDSDGTFTAQQELASGSVTWSPDGKSLVRTPDRVAKLSLQVDGKETRIALPKDAAVRGLVWETDSDLLVSVVDENRQVWLLRCRTGIGQCEVAARNLALDTRLPVRQ